MLYKNTKAMVCSPDGNRDLFNIAAGVLLRDTLRPYLLIICLDYVFQVLIDLIKKCLYAKKARYRQYTTEAITDASYADDLALLLNTPAQAKSLLQA